MECDEITEIGSWPKIWFTIYQYISDPLILHHWYHHSTTTTATTHTEQQQEQKLKKNMDYIHMYDHGLYVNDALFCSKDAMLQCHC